MQYILLLNDQLDIKSITCSYGPVRISFILVGLVINVEFPI